MESGEDSIPACHVCRCEEIELATIEAALAAGALTINDLKRRTRLGMGLCQGIYCLDHARQLIAALNDVDLAQVAPMTARPPVRSISLATISATSNPDEESR